MKNLLLAALLLLPLQSKALELQAVPNCQKNPTFCKILTLKPGIDRKFAYELSNHIYKYVKQFGFDPTISVAIAMQESSLENKNRMGTIIKDGKLVYGITDVGVFQIHVQTLANLQSEGNEIDTERLQSDVEYQTFWHAKILKSKIRTCETKREKLRVGAGNEWSCYHSFTYEQRKLYLSLVGSHLAKLSNR